MNAPSDFPNVSRRFLLAGLLAGVAAPALGDITSSPRPKLRPTGPRGPVVPTAAELIEKANLGGNISFAVADAASGEMRELYNPLKGMAPASTAKSVTTLYALDALGPDHRFTTRLLATGPISEGRLDGDLILQGSGDPTLDTDGLAELAKTLKLAGVQEVVGALRVDASALPTLYQIDKGQLVYAGYDPAISGLNLNYNRVHFEWKRENSDYTITMQARAAGVSPGVRIAHMEVEDRAAPLFAYEDRDGVDRWSVSRAALGKNGARWLPVRRPADYVADVFMTLARSRGIVLKRGADAQGIDGQEVARHDSAPLVEVLRDMLKYSTNLTAEVVGMTASKARGIPFANLATSAAAMNEWANTVLGTRNAGFVDHSGLGEGSRISASDMARVMISEPAQTQLRPILKSVPLRDKTRFMDKEHPLQVLAKTGTLDFVSGLVGYVVAPNGRLLAFAIYAGDLERRADAHEKGLEPPPGARGWNTRAKVVQQDLIERWVKLHANAPYIPPKPVSTTVPQPDDRASLEAN